MSVAHAQSSLAPPAGNVDEQKQLEKGKLPAGPLQSMVEGAVSGIINDLSQSIWFFRSSGESPKEDKKSS